MVDIDFECRGANPLLDAHVCVPDAEAHVWSDGRIYLYGSFDECGGDKYCTDKYHVFSSADMKTWTDHGVSFTLGDIKEDIGDARALYAPDCAYYNGVYYLYYCTNNRLCGVAASKSPYGPFEDLGLMKNVHGIDPAVLIDDDGSAYFYWGQNDDVRAARLLGGMTQIDINTVTQPLSVREHFFHEGGSVRKIDGKYYYAYTEKHRHGKKATAMGYSVSDKPLSGFVYKGVIVDNFGCDAESWNNHGSIERFGDNWYVFYHRSHNASSFSRKVCAEPIEINNGIITEAEMTSSGASGAVSAKAYTQSYRACRVSGSARISHINDSDKPFLLSSYGEGGAEFKYIDFQNESRISLRIKSDGECRAEIYSDGAYLTEITTAGDGVLREYSSPVPRLSGKRRLEIKFFGNFSSVCLDGFRFI